MVSSRQQVICLLALLLLIFVSGVMPQEECTSAQTLSTPCRCGCSKDRHSGRHHSQKSTHLVNGHFQYLKQLKLLSLQLSDRIYICLHQVSRGRIGPL